MCSSIHPSIHSSIHPSVRPIRSACKYISILMNTHQACTHTYMHVRIHADLHLYSVRIVYTWFSDWSGRLVPLLFRSRSLFLRFSKTPRILIRLISSESSL